MRAPIIVGVLCFLTYGYCQKSSDAAEDAPFEIVDEPGDELLIAHLTDDNMVQVEDMLMTREQFDELFQPAVEGLLGKRVAVAGHRWPSGTVPYVFAADLAVSKTAIRAAMNEWEKYTCVRFIPKRPTDKAYVVIRASPDKCSSGVGYSGNVQYINLAKNCETMSVLLHELGHTLGLLHEHQHPDRDKYIKILWSNIAEASKHNFVLKPSHTVATFGIAYDPASIMHYKPMGSKNCPKCNTIQSLNPALVNVMGQSKQLSPKSDIPIMKKMYCNA